MRIIRTALVEGLSDEWKCWNSPRFRSYPFCIQESALKAWWTASYCTLCSDSLLLIESVRRSCRFILSYHQRLLVRYTDKWDMGDKMVGRAKQASNIVQNFATGSCSVWVIGLGAVRTWFGQRIQATGVLQLPGQTRALRVCSFIRQPLYIG
jgi:hypothetical protein